MDSNLIKELHEKNSETFDKVLTGYLGYGLESLKKQGYVLADHPRDIIKSGWFFLAANHTLGRATIYGGKTYEYLYNTYGLQLFLKRAPLIPKKIFACEKEYPHGF